MAAQAAIIDGIIKGVLGTVSTITGAAGAKRQAERERQLRREEAEVEKEKFEKQLKLKERDQRLVGMDVLAKQRMDAQQMSRQRSFNKNALVGMRTAMQRRNQQATTATTTGGLPTTTFAGGR